MERELKDLKKCLLKYDLRSRLLILKWVLKLMEAGIAVGFTKKISKTLAIYTTIGTLALLEHQKKGEK